MLKEVEEGTITEEKKLILIQKIGKSATNAMVTQRATQAVNKALVEGKRKTENKKKQGTDTIDYSYGRWMGATEAKRRKEFKDMLFFQKEAAIPFFSSLTEDVFTCDIWTKATRPLSPAKHQRVFQAAVKPIFMALDLDMFAYQISIQNTKEPVKKISKAAKSLERVKKTATRQKKVIQRVAVQRGQIAAIAVQTRSGRMTTQIRKINSS
jgi:hypothetical protein